MSEDRQEAVWRERVRQAQEQYTQASVRCCEIQATTGGEPSPQQTVALKKAVRDEEEARAEYIRVLEIFTRLVQAGNCPETKQEAD